MHRKSIVNAHLCLTEVPPDLGDTALVPASPAPTLVLLAAGPG